MELYTPSNWTASRSYTSPLTDIDEEMYDDTSISRGSSPLLFSSSSPATMRMVTTSFNPAEPRNSRASLRSLTGKDRDRWTIQERKYAEKAIAVCSMDDLQEKVR